MIWSGSGALPRHLYVHVEGRFMGLAEKSWFAAVWFGLQSYPGRMWGCHCMLECGAVYRNLPPHAIAFKPDAPEWHEEDAQRWDCYGYDFSTLIYPYLDGLDVWAKIRDREIPASYLFTAVPIGDAFSAEPEQSKEFMFLRTFDDRLTVQPTNRCRFIEKSFTEQLYRADAAIPPLKTQTEVYTCE
jgi:hypothetical protein